MGVITNLECKSFMQFFIDFLLKREVFCFKSRVLCSLFILESTSSKRVFCQGVNNFLSKHSLELHWSINKFTADFISLAAASKSRVTGSRYCGPFKNIDRSSWFGTISGFPLTICLWKESLYGEASQLQGWESGFFKNSFKSNSLTNLE